ncbi:hypothetical protein EOM82_00010 [bacterium]|nr:hypothetical protein [bacterium]
MKFSGGCIGKALQIIFCIILGFVLCLLSIGGAGYIILTREGMVGTLSEKASSTVPLDFSEEAKKMSVLQWGQALMATFKDMNASTIGDIEKLAGVNVISKTVENMMGVSADIIKSSSVNNLAATISQNLTMANARDKFGIAFPDMPIFESEDFLNSPLSSAMENFDDYTLNQVIEITEEGNIILQKLGNVKINELGGAVTDQIIKSTTLGELMTITETSSKVLQALKYCCIESQYELDEFGTQVYKKATITEDDGLGGVVEKEIELIGINEKMETIVMSEILDITETSNVILRKMRVPTQEEIDLGQADLFGTEDLKLNELGGAKLNTIINTTTMGELITIDETSEPIMQALKDTSIEGINARISTLKLNEIFKPEDLNSGGLSLIDPETVLNDIPVAMTDAMRNSTVATLKSKGILEASAFTNVDSMPLAQRAFIYNSDMGDLLSGIINFIGDPVDTSGGFPVINYYHIQPNEITIGTDTFTSITQFVQSYSQYDSIAFNDGAVDLISITITIDEVSDALFYNETYACYVIPLFNILTDDVVISFVDALSNPVAAKFGVYAYDEVPSPVGLIRNQCAYYYAQTVTAPLEAVENTIAYQYPNP